MIFAVLCPSCRVLVLALLLAGCTTIASSAYKASVDERPLATLKDDTVIEAKIKKGLLDSGFKNYWAIDVYCHQAVVVLTGVVEPGSKLGDQAVVIAKAVEGVKRVETYFVPNRPSTTSDLAILAKIKSRIIGDGELQAPQVEISVIAGHVVLAGVVSRPARIDQFIRHARAVEGVVTVKSFIQVKSQ